MTECDASCELNNYAVKELIGEGGFSKVFKVVDRLTSERFAVKCIHRNWKKDERNRIQREIEILQTVHHKNVVQLKDVHHHNNAELPCPKTYFVLEYCRYDLHTVIRQKALCELKRRSLIRHLLNGVAYLHSNDIIHRDLKSRNLLVTEKGVLKIADFGLARRIHGTTTNRSSSSSNLHIETAPEPSSRNYTTLVGTLAYMAPEMLLGETNYGTSVDVWPLGCIMAEIWLKNTLMQSEGPNSQLYKIASLCGPMTPAVWPGVEKLEVWRKRPRLRSGFKRSLRKFLLLQQDAPPPLAVHLIDAFLTLDPTRRPAAELALYHDYFNVPLPVVTCASIC